MLWHRKYRRHSNINDRWKREYRFWKLCTLPFLCCVCTIVVFILLRAVGYWLEIDWVESAWWIWAFVLGLGYGVLFSFMCYPERPDPIYNELKNRLSKSVVRNSYAEEKSTVGTK